MSTVAQLFTCQIWAVFDTEHPNTADTVILAIVLCLVSLILLNKPPSRHSPLHLLPSPSPARPPPPILLLSQPLLRRGVTPRGVSELVTPSQHLLPRCVLWQHHVSAATVNDVRMSPGGGHRRLPLPPHVSFSVHYTDSTGCWSADRKGRVCQTVARDGRTQNCLCAELCWEPDWPSMCTHIFITLRLLNEWQSSISDVWNKTKWLV